jgi:hypothetical protein
MSGSSTLPSGLLDVKDKPALLQGMEKNLGTASRERYALDNSRQSVDIVLATSYDT